MVLHAVPTARLHIQGQPHPTGQGTQEYYRQLSSLSPPRQVYLILYLLLSIFCSPAYRSLQQRVAERSLSSNVVFHSSFLPDPSLLSLLSSADVYINSYVDEFASVSGSLTPPPPPCLLSLASHSPLLVPCLIRDPHNGHVCWPPLYIHTIPIRIRNVD
jgi:hypothetical protein